MTFLYWFLCFLIGIVPAFFVFRKDRKRKIPVRWLPATLRFITFFLTAALLLAPAFPGATITEEKPVIIWLQDHSLSVGNALGKDSIAYRKKTQALWHKWARDYKLITLSFGGQLEKDSLFRYTQNSTDMAGALQAVSDQYQDRNIGAIILSGDGVFNAGANPLYTSLPNEVPVYTIGLGDSTQPKDLLVSRIYANKTVPLNSKFELLADVSSTKLNGVHTTLSVTHNGKTIAQDPVTINNDLFSASFRFDLNASEKGFQRYTVSLPPLPGEKNLRNNSMDIFVEVVDQEIKILLLAAAPHSDIEAIKAALEANPGYKLTIRYGNSAPEKADDYALIIAHQVPSLTGVHLPGSTGKIPVWYILGSQSDLPAFSQAQSLLRVQNGGAPNDVLPVLNTGFRFFTLPADIQAVLAKMPPLKAPSGIYKITGDGQVLLKQQIGNVSSGFPLWAVQTGETPCAVLCGTGIWRWRLYEYKNFKKQETTDELIRQTVSLLSAKKDTRPFRVFMDKYVYSDNEPVQLFAELRNQNQELVNTPEATLVLQDSSGKKVQYTFEKEGLRYRLRLGTLAPGDYTFEGSVHVNGTTCLSKGAFKISAVPIELLRSYADFDLLYKLARQNRGAFFTPANMDTLSIVLQHNKQLKPVLHSEIIYRKWIDRKWFFFLILLFAAAEWLLRKYWDL